MIFFILPPILYTPWAYVFPGWVTPHLETEERRQSRTRTSGFL